MTNLNDGYTEGLNKLQESGINDGYEYVLRKLCSDGLPTQNYFELCANYLLEYENLLKENKIRNRKLKDLVEITSAKPIKKKIENKQPRIVEIKPKINLKSKQLAMTNFNIEIETKKFEKKDESAVLERQELKVLETDKEDNEKNSIDKINEYFDKRDSELRELKSIIPDHVSFTSIPNESFEVEVDIVNHVSESGGLEKFQYDVQEKIAYQKAEYEIKKEEGSNIEHMNNLQQEIDF